MKRIIVLFSGVVVMLSVVSCKKTTDYPQELSSAVFIHASNVLSKR